MKELPTSMRDTNKQQYLIYPLSSPILCLSHAIQHRTHTVYVTHKCDYKVHTHVVVHVAEVLPGNVEMWPKSSFFPARLEHTSLLPSSPASFRNSQSVLTPLAAICRFWLNWNCDRFRLMRISIRWLQNLFLCFLSNMLPWQRSLSLTHAHTHSADQRLYSRNGHRVDLRYVSINLQPKPRHVNHIEMWNDKNFGKIS